MVSETALIALLILDLKGACTTKQIVEIMGGYQSQQSLANILAHFRKKGLVKSMRYPIFVLLNRNLQPPQYNSLKEKVHVLSRPLEQMWQDPELQQLAFELFETSDLNAVRAKIVEILKLDHKG